MIKRRGVIGVPGQYKYGDVIEVKTAEELKAAAERQPMIMLTLGHPADGMPTSKDVIGTVHQKWNEDRQRIDAEFWFPDEKIPESIRAKVVNNEPLAISPGFMVDEVTPDGIQKGIMYTHLAVLSEEDPRCPLGTCGVNIRMDSTGKQRRLDQKTELAPAEPKESAKKTDAPKPEVVKVAEQKPEPTSPAEQKPEAPKEEVKEPVKEVPLVPEVIIPVPASPGPHQDWETHGTVIKYVPRKYRTKENT